MFSTVVLLQLSVVPPLPMALLCAPRPALCSSARPSPHHLWFSPRYRQRSWCPPVSELGFCPVLLQILAISLLFAWCSCVVLLHLAFLCRAASSFGYSIVSVLPSSIPHPTRGGLAPLFPPPYPPPWPLHGLSMVFIGWERFVFGAVVFSLSWQCTTVRGFPFVLVIPSLCVACLIVPSRILLFITYFVSVFTHR